MRYVPYLHRVHEQFFGDGIYLSSYILGPSVYLTLGAGSTL